MEHSTHHGKFQDLSVFVGNRKKKWTTNNESTPWFTYFSLVCGGQPFDLDFFIFWLICGMVAQQPSDKETYDRQPVSTCIESMA